MKSNQSQDLLLDQQMTSVLAETIKILFPLDVDPSNLIKPHVWRDRRYVGEKDGRVLAWRGWSANLVEVDFRYRAIFFDVVDNLLPGEERVRLFGADFAHAVSDAPRFVVMFVLDFPTDSVEVIKDQGFVPRTLSRAAHACIIAGIEEFLDSPILYWAAKVARLVMLQRVLSIHRKPLDSDEVPLQNLLYSTGYLHSYIVKSGLELHRLSRPRKHGEFGHDLHAVVRNPNLESLLPFDLGIELYTGAMGYHIDTVPEYAREFQLRGMIIIAKDDPFLALSAVADSFDLPLFRAAKLTEMGRGSSLAIHHLALDKVVLDLTTVRDKLDTLIPVAPRYID